MKTFSSSYTRFASCCLVKNFFLSSFDSIPSKLYLPDLSDRSLSQPRQRSIPEPSPRRLPLFETSPASMSKLSCVTRSSSTVPVKRKSVSSRWTRSTVARPDFNGLKALPLHRLPPTVLSAVSKSLASRLTRKFDTLERSKQ